MRRAKTIYAPGEVVDISGAGFELGDYAIPVMRPNGSIVLIDPVTHAVTPGWDTVTTDSSGDLSYNYQLDGVLGTYEVRAYPAPWSGDWDEMPVASVTFTDGPLPSNVKLQQWETVPTGNWITGNLGSNNSDYVEGETVPFRLDVSGLAVSGNPYTFSVCRDYQNGTKRGYLSLAPYNTSRAAVPGGTVTSTNGPFSGVNITINSFTEVGGQGACNAGQRETQVSINSTAAAASGVGYVLWGGRLASPADSGVGAGNGAGSYPGSSLAMTLLQPSKNVSINPGAIKKLATLTVQKVVDSGSATPDQWCFNISPNPNGETLPKCPTSGGNTVTFVGLPTGNYQVTETSVSGYSFASGSGTNCTFSGSTATASVTAATTPVDATCIFHNAINRGHIIIDKVTNPGADPTQFSFTLTGGPSAHNQSFQLADQTAPHDSGAILPGSGYNAAETVPAGWSLASATCSDNSPVTNIDVSAGETVTCTFTNTKLPRLTVNKVLVPSGDSGKFNLQIDGATAGTGANVGNGGTTGAVVVSVGSHTVGETAGTGTSLSDYTSTIGGDCASNGSITLAAGDSKVCTITNTKLTASIAITKTADAATVNAGDTIGFVITVRNNGNGSASTVLVTDTLPANTGLSWSIAGGTGAGQCTISSGVLTCNFGSLAAGASKTVHITSPTTAASCGTVDNTAVVTTSNDGSDQDSASITVQCPHLQISKTADAAVADAGDTIGFTITVTNTGPGVAKSVTLTDALPSGSGISWMLTPSVSGCTISSGTLSCAFGDLAAGASKTVHVSSPTSAASCASYPNSASAQASNNPSVQASASVMVNCGSIQIAKEADASPVSAGASIGFVITVTNGGSGTARTVLVTDTLPANTGLSWSIAGGTGAGQCTISSGVLTCNFGSLAAGASKTVHITSPTTAASCGTVNNTAVVTTSNDGSDQDSASITVQCPALAISKTADAAVVDAGDEIGFTISVSNGGPGVAKSVTLTDALPSGSGISWTLTPSVSGCTISSGTLSCAFGDLAAGASVSVHVSSPTSAASCASYPNSASAEASNNPAVEDSASVTVNCAAISILKTADVSPVSAGDEIGFSIVVANGGSGTARSVVVSDTLPANAGLSWTLDPAVAGCSISAGLLTCNFGNLASDATRTVHITSPTTAASCGTVDNTATVTASNNPAVEDGASVTVQCPDLAISKTADASPVSAGDEIGFTITVTNTGAGVAKSVTLSDALPSGSGISWTLTPPLSGCTISSGTLSCAFGDLAAGASVSVHVSSPTSAASCASYPNSASAQASNNPSVQASASVTVQCPDLAISKTADASPVNAGDSVGFTLVVSNTGTGIARSVLLTDTLPNSINWTLTPAVSGCTISSGVLTCNFGDLAAGASKTIHLSGVTTAANCGVLTNSAVVSARNEASAAQADNRATATITVQCPSLTVTKIADAAAVDAGNPIGFTITVSNGGPGVAKNVTLSDPLPSGAGISWTINPPVSGCTISSGTLNCSFGNMAAGASFSVHVTSPTAFASCGSYTNTATAQASNQAAVQGQASVAVRCPRLTLTKRADAATVNAGSPIGFTITVSNGGTGTAQNVVISDPLPSGTGISWTINPPVSGCAISVGTLTCTIASLAPGASFSVHVSSPTRFACATFTNVATVWANNHPTLTAQASVSVNCLHPGTIGFWRNWRNHYTSSQFQRLIDYLKANNPKVYNKDRINGTADDLTIAKIDAIFNFGSGTPRDQMILGQLSALKLNLAVTQLNGSGGIVQKNDNICLAGVVNVSGIAGAAAFFGSATPTIRQVVDAVENKWTGKLTTTRSDWKFNLNASQQDMVIKVLTGINEGTIVLTSGC